MIEKIKKVKLKNLFKEFLLNGEAVKGYYAYKDYFIKISRIKPLTLAERSRKLYDKRRESGLCVVCGKKVTKRKPGKDELFRLCEVHRVTIDKERSAKNKKKTLSIEKAKKRAANKKNAKKKVVKKTSVRKTAKKKIAKKKPVIRKVVKKAVKLPTKRKTKKPVIRKVVKKKAGKKKVVKKRKAVTRGRKKKK